MEIIPYFVVVVVGLMVEMDKDKHAKCRMYVSEGLWNTVTRSLRPAVVRPAGPSLC